VPRTAKIILAASIALALVSCGRRDVITASEAGVSLLVNRTACPAVATPVHTNEITLFSPRSSRDANAIDVVAVITNIRSSCNDLGDSIQTIASFEIQARRTNGSGARQLVLPYFATVLRGTGQVVSKEIGRVGINFADGQTRASTTGQATSLLTRAAVTLPPEIEERLTRRRRPGDVDAALDPMSNPEVRTAVNNITFELLVGFQLDPDQLEYNATR
jgi:hypothetical protein